MIDMRICVAELDKVWENYVFESTIKNYFAEAGLVSLAGRGGGM